MFLIFLSIFHIRGWEVTYAAHSYTMLVKSRPLDHVCFQCVVNLWYEFEGQCLYRISIFRFRGQIHATYLQYGRRRYAVTQQIIQLRTDLQKPRWRMFCHYLIRNLSDESFPIWRRDGGLIRDFLAVMRRKHSG